jgi:hypothetical protein
MRVSGPCKSRSRRRASRLGCHGQACAVRIPLARVVTGREVENRGLRADVSRTSANLPRSTRPGWQRTSMNPLVVRMASTGVAWNISYHALDSPLILEAGPIVRSSMVSTGYRDERRPGSRARRLQTRSARDRNVTETFGRSQRASKGRVVSIGNVDAHVLPESRRQRAERQQAPRARNRQERASRPLRTRAFRARRPSRDERDQAVSIVVAVAPVRHDP